MRSSISNYYSDSNSRFVLNLHGLKRWIISPPSYNKNLYLTRSTSFSQYFSEVNWLNPDYQKYPLFSSVMSNEIILQEGEILYLPRNWFSYVITLNIASECSYL